VLKYQRIFVYRRYACISAAKQGNMCFFIKDYFTLEIRVNKTHARVHTSRHTLPLIHLLCRHEPADAGDHAATWVMARHQLVCTLLHGDHPGTRPCCRIWPNIHVRLVALILVWNTSEVHLCVLNYKSSILPTLRKDYNNFCNCVSIMVMQVEGLVQNYCNLLYKIYTFNKGGYNSFALSPLNACWWSLHVQCQFIRIGIGYAWFCKWVPCYHLGLING